MSRETELKAADDLESLIPYMQQMIEDIRAGKGQVYSRVYHFRTDIGRIVASLGSGPPPRVRE